MTSVHKKYYTGKAARTGNINSPSISQNQDDTVINML